MAKAPQGRKKSGLKPKRQQKDLPPRGASARGGGTAQASAFEALERLAAAASADAQSKAQAVQSNIDTKKAIGKLLDKLGD